MGDETAELMKSKDEQLQILKMVKLESDWKKPNNAKKAFGNIIKKLQCLHEKYGPHGDIRLANLLSSGHIIDFDFVGMENYPATLNLITKDGRRHPDVVEMISANANGEATQISIEKTHDWFSLGKVMQLFQPMEDSNTETWKKVRLLVAGGKIEEELQKNLEYDIELVDDSIPLRGTGNQPNPRNGEA